MAGSVLIIFPVAMPSILRILRGGCFYETHFTNEEQCSGLGIPTDLEGGGLPGLSRLLPRPESGSFLWPGLGGAGPATLGLLCKFF